MARITIEEIQSQLASDGWKLISETYQNERWHWNSNVTSSKKKMKLLLGSDGRNPGNESADEIWDDLLDDCFDDNEIKITYIGKPRIKTGKELKLDLTEKQKIILPKSFGKRYNLIYTKLDYTPTKYPRDYNKMKKRPL